MKQTGTDALANFVWHDVSAWGVEGRGWAEENRQNWFDRLPASAKQTVTRPIWDLSLDSSGMMVRFETDADSIGIKCDLRSGTLAMAHMPASGVSGMDLYARDTEGNWRWVGSTKPTEQHLMLVIAKGLSPSWREYAMYLPLYNGVDSLRIGVPDRARFQGLAPRLKPIVFYGTSITQGACASRPGMVHTAILGRRLEKAVVNLGFSGNGHMDQAICVLMGQIDAAAYVIDCLPNMNPSEVAARCSPFVQQLRAERPETPIILVEDHPAANAWIVPSLCEHSSGNHKALRSAFEGLIKQRVKNLYYIPGDQLYGDDGEGSVDGEHASDLGFMRQADVMEPILRAALAQ